MKNITDNQNSTGGIAMPNGNFFKTGLLAVLLAGTGAAYAAPTYNLIDLGILGGSYALSEASTTPVR